MAFRSLVLDEGHATEGACHDRGILYATKYGSTRAYARWIAEATGLALHDMHRDHPDLESLDFLVIGMPVIYHRLYGRKWVLRHRDAFSRKPSILFTVSGVPAGERLDRWVADSLPSELIQHMCHIAPRGRQNPKDLNLWDRTMLIIGGLTSPDRKAGREELHGFDFMDRDGIRPVVDLIERCKRGQMPPAGAPATTELAR